MYREIRSYANSIWDDNNYNNNNSIVNLANGDFACDIRYHIIGVCLSSCVSPCDSISSSGSVIGNRALCAGYIFFSVAGQHCCSSMGLLC